MWRQWVTVRRVTLGTVGSRRIFIAFYGNCQDPDRRVGTPISSLNPSPGVAKVHRALPRVDSCSQTDPRPFHVGAMEEEEVVIVHG